MGRWDTNDDGKLFTKSFPKAKTAWRQKISHHGSLTFTRFSHKKDSLIITLKAEGERYNIITWIYSTVQCFRIRQSCKLRKSRCFFLNGVTLEWRFFFKWVTFPTLHCALIYYLSTVAPRIVRIQTVRFHYSVIIFLVPKYSIL